MKFRERYCDSPRMRRRCDISQRWTGRGKKAINPPRLHTTWPAAAFAFGRGRLSNGNEFPRR